MKIIVAKLILILFCLSIFCTVPYIIGGGEHYFSILFTLTAAAIAATGIVLLLMWVIDNSDL